MGDNHTTTSKQSSSSNNNGASSSSTTNSNNIDLDLFLTGVESKLRGPFTSLELTKVLTTPALRGSHLNEAQYLNQVSKVFSRADKVIQMRILIGLLGLEPDDDDHDGNNDLDAEIAALIDQAQEAPRHEEWVRVIAGLVQGILFRKNNSNNE